MTLADVLLDWRFLILAVGFGLFFGAYGVSMVVAAGPPRPKVVSPRIRAFAALELIFQFWFNFAGGFVGWVAVAFLWHQPYGEYGWKDLAAVIIAFVGVTGNLPHLSTGIRAAMGGVAKRLTGGERRDAE